MRRPAERSEQLRRLWHALRLGCDLSRGQLPLSRGLAGLRRAVHIAALLCFAFALVKAFTLMLFMTTLTTILGLVSLMIPPDPLFFAMGVVISFGLAAGTLLTLVLVPVLYSMFFKVKEEA